MIQINACEYPACIPLGRVGENLAREIVFDIRCWATVYGPGTTALLHQRQGDDAPYPCVIIQEEGIVRWPITDADVAAPGEGLCELAYYVGDTIVKSESWRTAVMDSLGSGEEAPPDPEKSWVDEVLKAADDIKKAVPPGGAAGQVLTKRSDADMDTEWKTPTGGGGFSYHIGHGLKVTGDNTLEVNAVSDFEGDNTLPITAAAVQETVGNIEVLLGTI